MFLLAKYNTQTTFTFPMIKRAVVDFAIGTDWTPAAADSAISKDNGAFVDTTNTVAIGTGTPTRGVACWKLTLTATELSCAVATVQIIDAATKVVEDQCLIILTYGNAAAAIPLDLSINQTGDSFARIGATGSGLTSLASQSSVNTVGGYIDTEIGDIQSRLPAALVGGKMDSHVNDIAANAITATAINADAITAAKIADAAIDAATFAAGAINAAAIADGAIDAATFAAGAINAAAIADGAIDDAAVATDMDAYHAIVWVVKESTTNDHYAVVFLKNGQPITSGITSPTIQVIKASDGTDLIASTALTEVGSLGIYKNDEGTNKLTAGAIYFAKVTATIDGSTRTWLQQVGRDSS